MAHTEAQFQTLQKRVIQLERDLLHARKLQAMGLLAAGMAHDFNNILSAIGGYSELLQHRFGSTHADIVRYTGVISESCSRAAGMVERLKLLTRKDRRKETLMDAHALLEELQEVITFTLPSRYKVTWDLGAASHWLAGDPSLFQGAILHLLILAREALPKGGNLTIRTSNFSARIRESAPKAILAVDLVSSDDKLDWTILELLLQTRPSEFHSRDAELAGLRVVNEYLESLGGGISLDRVADTTVRLRLVFPLKVLQDAERIVAEENMALLAQSQAQLPEQVHIRHKVLIVDDDALIRDFLTKMLVSIGAECICAEDEYGVEVLLQQGELFSYAMVDQNLQNDDGLDVCAKLRDRIPGLQIGLMTGAVGEMDPRVLQTKGILLFEKPFDIARIRNWISGSSRNA